jgi:hypothetical protein
MHHNKKRQMRTLLIIWGIVLILSSCEKRQPKIDYSSQNQKDSLTMGNIVNDTSKVLISELPIYFDSTDYLIHPVGFVSLSDRENKGILKTGSFSSRDYSNNDFSVESSHNDFFSGSITNLVFEELKSRNQRLLTGKMVCITNVQYLRDLSKKIKRQYLLYSVIDKDLNHDGELNYQDIGSLYISKIDGSDFKKITIDYHEYKGGELIIQDLKYFYRTIEDTNKDGSFDKKDKYHYYFIDFANESYKVIEYNPLKLITK